MAKTKKAPKKKAAKKAPPKKAPARKAKPKQSKAAAERVLRDGPLRVAARTKPRQQQLPGTEQLRNQQLDALCEQVADARTKKSEASTEEANAKSTALSVMRRDDVHAYSHAGVTFVVVPGDAKLVVKWKRDTASANGDGDGDDYEPYEEVEPGPSAVSAMDADDDAPEADPQV